MSTVRAARTAQLQANCEAILGNPPTEFQVQATLSILDGKDTVVAASTGAGKSRLFRMPFLVSETRPDAMIIVVTPLKALQNEQAKS